jgi:hypothetical protein
MLMLTQGINAQFCNFLYPTSGSNYAGKNGINTATSNAFPISTTNTNGMITLALIITTMMLMIVGMVYGIGYAFGIGKLIEFSKTEIFEAFLNFVIIILVFGGGLLVQNVVIMTSEIINTGIANVGITSMPLTSTMDIYRGLCNNYEASAFQMGANFLKINSEIFMTSIVSNIIIQLQPQQILGLFPLTPGLSFTPGAGLTVLNGGLKIIADIFGFTIGIYIFMIFVLFVIFYLFPIFLYLGIILRTFPWTRAAGGSMLALFISFYIVFPAILYPLSFSSLISSSALTVQTSQFSVSMGSSISSFMGSLMAPLTGGSSIATFLEDTIMDSAPSLIDVFGFIIAFIVSYDLLEALGDLLGAPSFTGRSMFAKII